MKLNKETLRLKQAKIIWLVIGIVYLFIWSLPLWNTYSGSGTGTAEAVSLIRSTSNFNWTTIVFLLLVIYIVFDEIQKGRLGAVLAAAAFFFTDFFNEIWNALFYRATGFAAVWQAVAPTSFQTLIGWNIEIMMMFFIAGITSTKLLPKDKDQVYFGFLNNRHFHAIMMSAIFVAVEIILNLIGALPWNYWWWQPQFPWVLFIIGYLPCFEVLYMVYDLPDIKSQVKVVSLMAAVLIPAFIILTSFGII